MLRRLRARLCVGFALPPRPGLSYCRARRWLHARRRTANDAPDPSSSSGQRGDWRMHRTVWLRLKRTGNDAMNLSRRDGLAQTRLTS
ncbi:uncharacterized protein TRAVEDRAFT_68355, partial [Trametes versicolor FP-101664 SS1]|uniref:uncharacterized protein n=1 Tax=Trametes versicolor (strain FP-101664) TaxID=717944 RepID=UPI00046234A8